MNEPNHNYQKQFPVVCPQADSLNHKPVQFQAETRMGMKIHHGTFHVHHYLDGKVFVDIDCPTLGTEIDPPPLGWSLHLSQAHVDSIERLENTDAYRVGLAFLARHYIPDTQSRQGES